MNRFFSTIVNKNPSRLLNITENAWNKMTNIIYILPSEKGPAGGIKVILQHAELINKIQKKNLSKIIFIKKKKTSKWKNSVEKFFDLKAEEGSTGWKFNQIAVDTKNKTK